MARTSRDKLERQRERVRNLVDGGTISEACGATLIEWSDALDEKTVGHKYRDDDGEIVGLKPRTVKSYLQSVRLCIEAGLSPLEASAADVNALMDEFHDVEGKSKSTLAKYQSALKTFFRYHDDLGVDPEDIVTFTPDSTPKHDELDMFEESEVTALRQACGETQSVVRNRAFLELLVFTGQRIMALLTLRLRDVDVQEGYVYLNDDYDAEFGELKGALRRGRKRPMFGARKYVRDYVQMRRSGADPDDWLFVGNPSHPQTADGEHWSRNSANGMLKKLAGEADIEKPVNPHNFRHYCCTILKRDYDVDPETIKMLFGHVQGSDTLEETYSHLFDDDYIQKAEVALGVKEEKKPSTFTPDICPTCGEILEDHWRRCPSCEEVFGPSEDFEKDLEEVTERARDEGIQNPTDANLRVAQAMSEAGVDPEAVVEALADLDD